MTQIQHEQAPPAVASAPPALRFSGVSLLREGRTLLAGIDWTVGAGERWVILGPNGSGKTTMLQLAGAVMQPSLGTVEVLGRRLGRVDVRQLRTHIGLVSGAVSRALRPTLTALEIVVTGKHAALEPWWHEYSAADYRQARQLLSAAGMPQIAERPFAVISEGERQQTLLARALMGSPELILLDEPAAGLDLGARERLLAWLSRLAADPATPPLVLVTHHAEEIPAGTTHAALLREGRLVAAGPIEQALTDASVSESFGLRVRLRRDGGRWSSRAELI